MHHAYLDEHSGIDSFVHRLDPRVKLLSLLAFVLFVVLTPPAAYAAFVLYGALIAGLILLSKIPLRFILKRSLAIIPFALVVSAFIPFMPRDGATVLSQGGYNGWPVLGGILAKAYLSILGMILFMNSMRFADLLKALQRLGFPQLIIMVLSFMYRYIFVLQDELMRMAQAKRSRSTGGRQWLHIRALANMIGVLFVRTYERGEAVYLAMCSRGFAGGIPTMDRLQLRRGDILFLFMVIAVLAGIRIVKG